MYLLYSILNLFFPSNCVYCGGKISYADNNLCQDCLGSIDLIENQCQRCSGLIINGNCEICSDREFYIEKNVTIAEYSGVMKEILHYYKFSNSKRLYKHISKLASERLLNSRIKFDLITSVPMNRKKKWKRGYNQSELVAKELSKKFSIPYKKLLSEKKNSDAQRNLGYTERFLNVINRYSLKKKIGLNDRNILIIDDVFTTGATLNECSRMLSMNGSNRVFSLTFARAGTKKLELE